MFYLRTGNLLHIQETNTLIPFGDLIIICIEDGNLISSLINTTAPNGGFIIKSINQNNFNIFLCKK